MGKAQKGKGFQREGTGTHFSSLPNFPPFFPSSQPQPPPPPPLALPFRRSPGRLNEPILRNAL